MLICKTLIFSFHLISVRNFSWIFRYIENMLYYTISDFYSHVINSIDINKKKMFYKYSVIKYSVQVLLKSYNKNITKI